QPRSAPRAEPFFHRFPQAFPQARTGAPHACVSVARAVEDDAALRVRRTRRQLPAGERSVSVGCTGRTDRHTPNAKNGRSLAGCCHHSCNGQPRRGIEFFVAPPARLSRIARLRWAAVRRRRQTPQPWEGASMKRRQRGLGALALLLPACTAVDVPDAGRGPLAPVQSTAGQRDYSPGALYAERHGGFLTRAKRYEPKVFARYTLMADAQ